MTPTAEQDTKMNALRTAADRASTDYLTELQRAMTLYSDQASKTPFDTWAKTWAPRLATLSNLASSTRSRICLLPP